MQSNYSYWFAILAKVYGWQHKDILKLTTRQFFIYLRYASRFMLVDKIVLNEAVLLPYQDKAQVRLTLSELRDRLLLLDGMNQDQMIEDSWKSLRHRRKLC